MSQAPRDQNYIPSLLVASSIDGETPVVVWGNPVTHAMFVEVGGSGFSTDATIVSPLGSTTSNNAVSVVIASDQSLLRTETFDSSGNGISSTANALDVNIKSGFGSTIAVTQSTSPWVVSQDVATTGGWSVGNFTSGDTYTALTNSAQVIKGSAGKFGGYYIYNPNAAATYVMVYDVAAASVTVGTTTAKLVFCIPATGGANIEILAGIPFSTAMSIAAATTGGGNTAPGTALEAMVWFK